jgi:hypothetical protein
MKRTKLASLLTACAVLLGAQTALAQENWTEGPVWGCGTYRSEPGQYQAYVKYLRATALPIAVEQKKQGLILDFKVFVQPPHDASDWDVMICSLHANYAQALDYNKADDDKLKAIRAKQFKTADEQKQQELTKARLEMRKFIAQTYVREVNLRPLP